MYYSYYNTVVCSHRATQPTMTTSADDDNGDNGDDNCQRREEELEALLAVYGDKLELPHNNHNGPWRIRVASKVTLELLLPVAYPSKEAPTPRIHAPHFILNETDVHKLEQELVDMYSPDTEVAILWAEHCRSILLVEEDTREDDAYEEEEDVHQQPAANDTVTNQPEDTSTDTRTFVPANARFGQPIRRFDARVIMDPAHRRTIYRGSPFHPPKAGPAELFLAHVASVESMSHVHWVLAELLFNDKKVAKASHNMFAYRFTPPAGGTDCEVSDNDDDGEKGSGTKLAALLELSNATNVFVLVSRWYGGVQLGPARFKYIASTARDVLEEHGFLLGKGKK
jgi:Uncharacterized protein family UPF0029